MSTNKTEVHANSLNLQLTFVLPIVFSFLWLTVPIFAKLVDEYSDKVKPEVSKDVDNEVPERKLSCEVEKEFREWCFDTFKKQWHENGRSKTCSGDTEVLFGFVAATVVAVVNLGVPIEFRCPWELTAIMTVCTSLNYIFHGRSETFFNPISPRAKCFSGRFHDHVYNVMMPTCRYAYAILIIVENSYP